MNAAPRSYRCVIHVKDKAVKAAGTGGWRDGCRGVADARADKRRSDACRAASVFDWRGMRYWDRCVCVCVCVACLQRLVALLPPDHEGIKHLLKALDSASSPLPQARANIILSLFVLSYFPSCVFSLFRSFVLSFFRSFFLFSNSLSSFLFSLLSSWLSILFFY
jgi:hypothetical protein